MKLPQRTNNKRQIGLIYFKVRVVGFVELLNRCKGLNIIVDALELLDMWS